MTYATKSRRDKVLFMTNKDKGLVASHGKHFDLSLQEKQRETKLITLMMAPLPRQWNWNEEQPLSTSLVCLCLWSKLSTLLINFAAIVSAIKYFVDMWIISEKYKTNVELQQVNEAPKSCCVHDRLLLEEELYS